jgi:hypothetical protein
MFRIKELLVLTIVLALGALPVSAQQKKPNIVVIFGEHRDLEYQRLPSRHDGRTNAKHR